MTVPCGSRGGSREYGDGAAAGLEALFVVVTGLPGSGKSTLARRLSPLLDLPVIDKDDDLDSLFEARGTGSSSWRRALSRESGQLFRARASSVQRALLVSFWHLDGMRVDSGTPTDWLRDLPGPKVQIWCRCPVREAARRFVARERHPGHLDEGRDSTDLVDQLEALARLEPLSHGTVIRVDTTSEPDPDIVADQVRRAANAV